MPKALPNAQDDAKRSLKTVLFNVKHDKSRLKELDVMLCFSGMTSNACTDFNHTVYYVSLGSEHLTEGLKVLAEVGPALVERRSQPELRFRSGLSARAGREGGVKRASGK